MANITEEDIHTFERRYMASPFIAAKSINDNANQKKQTLATLVSNIRQIVRQYGSDFLSTIRADDGGVFDDIIMNRIAEADITERLKKRLVAIIRFVEVVFAETEDENGWQRYNSHVTLSQAIDILMTRWADFRESLRQEHNERVAIMEASGDTSVELNEHEDKLFIADWNRLMSKLTEYLTLTRNVTSLYVQLSDQAQLAQNRLAVALYLIHGPARLEFMKLVARLAETQNDRIEMDAMNLNYVYLEVAINGRRSYGIKINDHKTASSHEKYHFKLSEVEAEAYRTLLPLVRQLNLFYLFAHNDRVEPFNFTLRLQEAFDQAIGVPLSVEVLRKMYVRRILHNNDVNNVRAQLVQQNMRTNIDTVLRYYVFDLPNTHVDPQIIINQPLHVRRGKLNKQSEEEKNALEVTQGILWDKVGAGRAANPWLQFKNSDMVVVYNGRRKKISTIFENRSTNTIAAMAKALKKKQLLTI